MKPCYLYDPTTGLLLGESVAFASPAEPGSYLIPNDATFIAPPTSLAANEAAVFAAGAWSVVPDHRGEVWFDVTGAEHVIRDLGVVPDAAWTNVAPPPTAAQLATAARSERDKRIAAVSWRYERYAREARLGLVTTDNLSVLDTYVQALADITVQVEFPTNILWPVSP